MYNTQRDYRGLFEAIAHGDGEHRAWLKQAIEAYFAWKRIPPPRGKGTQDLQNIPGRAPAKE